jgi:hypothetical protein
MHSLIIIFLASDILAVVVLYILLRRLRSDNKILKKEVVRLIQFNQEQSELNKQLVKGLSIALHHENSISIPYYGVVGQA